jgi:acetyl-CoA synthetase
MPPHVTPEELVDQGIEPAEAATLAGAVNRALSSEPIEAWREISQRILRPDHSLNAHRLLFATAMRDWNAGQGPAPAWTPDAETIAATNVGRMVEERGLKSVAELHEWSAARRDEFWAHMIDRLGIRLARPYASVCDLTAGIARPNWLAGAKLNIVESCFQAEADKPAVECHDEKGAVSQLTYGELNSLVNRAANGLAGIGLVPGDAVAIYLPMTIEAVTIYLAIIRAGCVAVSIADSLAAEEIAVRLRLSNAKAVFTQDAILRGGKHLPLYTKVIEAQAPRALVIGASGSPKLRSGDLDWRGFVSENERFEPYLADPHEPTNILFSSGTTGEPKAVPWTHTTPIKCAVDGHLHQDVQPQDRVAWPTNLGWMMGPWLIYAGLIHRATLALYDGTPTTRGFGQFVEKARVTMLGVIPSLVKTWRSTGCMGGLNWSAIRRFSSTGECSNPDDMLFLMSLAGYKPVIEYCGGTELGGGYIGATMAQPNVLSAFSIPSFGVDLTLVDDAGCLTESGEVFLVPPAIGMSTDLLHHDHDEVYFAGAPRGPRGETLRRHGDALERLPGGYYRAQGRVDDTMNLGGIKISSVEIERVLNAVDGIRETAAVAISPPGGGPSTLWIFAVRRGECQDDDAQLRGRLQDAIRRHLNPLFKIEKLVAIESLPRTASHKIMRRLLRDDALRMMAEAL